MAHLFRTTEEHPAECSKSPSSKAAGESKPEAYPLGYVEDFDEPRTPLADFFSILLGAAAFRTKGGFFCCLTLFSGQGEELFALVAGANFEVGGSLVVDVGGQEQLQRVISDRAAVGEFDDSQAVVKDLEGSFLPFSGQYMPEDEHRLSLTFRAQVS
jgi:hypothetical protein